LSNTLERAFLYIDILGFGSLVRSKSEKVDAIFKFINQLNIYRDDAFQTVVFSDTILFFSKDDSRPLHLDINFLVEYAQDLFYKLMTINVCFRGVITFGEFNYSRLKNIEAYYGLALINAYEDEKKLPGLGLFIDKRLSKEIVIFSSIQLQGQYDFVILCKCLDDLYDHSKGILPFESDLFTETDTFARLDEELRFFREIEYLRLHHPLEKVRVKYDWVYNTYKTQFPLFFKTFEKEGFFPYVINSNYIGGINFTDLLSEVEFPKRESN
jgi:hypothetical protein